MTDRVAWDCHVHVIGDRDHFPLAPSCGYEPPDAPVEALLAHLDRLGAERAVIVQPSVYGYDNSCMLDAIDCCDGRCIGVCVPDPDTTVADLERLHKSGVRGIRCNLVNTGGLELGQSKPWWSWMRKKGWHLQLQIDATRLDIAALVDRNAMPPVVVDHMGYPPRGTLPDGITSLLRALSDGLIHVKISAPYRVSAVAPPYPDATALALALLAARANRCLFASDWPHTETSHPPMAPADWRLHIQRRAGPLWRPMQESAKSFYGNWPR